MDESGARLVHGGVERFADLEAVHYCNWNWCARFRRIQSTRVRHLFGHLSGNGGIGHQRIKIGRVPSPTETCTNRAHGVVAKSASKVSYPLQETDHTVF